MMETFLEDAENHLHQRNSGHDGSCSSDDSEDPLDDPFLYDKFLADPAWKKKSEQEEQAQPKNLVDPGLFRYNKRVFVTSLPALLVVLALGGENLILLVAVGTAVITMMAQLGDSRRCVVTFIVFFIPTHTYVLATVVPLLWLSGWHLLLVAVVNIYVILTAAWVMLQFEAFRMEEVFMSALVEQLLFTLYPLTCTALVCWALGAVIAGAFIPIVFSLMWFVLLQLYLIPSLSSFRIKTTPDENLDVVQTPIVILTVLTFVMMGPLLHVAISWITGTEMLAVSFWMQLCFTLSLTLFLSSLLSIRQVFEHLGQDYLLLIRVRWASGAICTALCYPVFHGFGLDSHFLPLLPVSIAIFAALGLVLAFKSRRLIVVMLAIVLIVCLIALFVLWIYGMPRNLQHYFMGIFPLNAFYLIICNNFLLCLLCLWTASIDTNSQLGVFLVGQALVLTICEISLHNAKLYSTSLIQLTSISATYTIHRLQLVEKISKMSAIISSAIHMAKCISSVSSLIINEGKGEITLLEMSALALMMFALVSVFVYGTSGKKSGYEVGHHLIILLLALAINSYHFLLPLAMLLFEGSTSYTNVIGLWCLIGGGLTLLYSQAVVTKHMKQVLKVALALGIMGVVVLVLHPHLAFTWYSLFHWLELLDYLALCAVLSCQIQMSPMAIVLVTFSMAICPGIRMAMLLWPHVTLVTSVLCVLMVVALLVLIFICIFITDFNATSEKILKYNILIAISASVGLLVLDVASFKSLGSAGSPPVSWFDLPALKAMAVAFLTLAVVLKVFRLTKTPGKLPIMANSEESSRLFSLPVMSNAIVLAAFLLALMQGPTDPFLHDLWCCMCTVVLSCLHQDGVFLPKLLGDKQATPTIMASIFVLFAGTVLRSRFWSLSPLSSAVGGFFELILALTTLPIFYVLWSILWRGQASWGETAVVFLTPYNVLLLLQGSSYTSWGLSGAGLGSGIWMMAQRLPMVPYSDDPQDHYR